MYVLALVAVACAAYIIRCFVRLRKSSLMPDTLINVADASYADGGFDHAIAVCTGEGGVFAEILWTVIVTRSLTREAAEAIIEGTGRRALFDLSRSTLALEVISGVSTLLGLLGTVTGMYSMMMSITSQGIKDISGISGGIGEALVTTIAGLAIAIPAYVAYVYFNRKVEDIVLEMENYAIHLMARVRKDTVRQSHRSFRRQQRVAAPAPEAQPQEPAE